MILTSDYVGDHGIVQRRMVFGVTVVVVLMAILLVRLIQIQVFQYQRYSTMALENQIYLAPLPPVRGIIYDRHGEILAQNKHIYTLEVLPEKVADMDLLLSQLGELITLDEDDVSRFRELLRRRPAFEWQTIRSNLDEEQASRMALHQHRYPGVELRARLQRYYPIGELTNPVVGYVGRISGSDLLEIDRKTYRGLDYIGRRGIEAQYESILRGKPGVEHVETNAHGRAVRSLGYTAPLGGQSIHLSLDIGLQRKSMEELQSHEGAVVALDPKNGDVLAFASAPGFDPNPFVNGMSHEAYNVLRTSNERPLLNRALFGRYAPGSTIKGFLLLAGMENGLDVEKRIVCPGWYSLPNSTHLYRDWKEQGHGSMNGYDSIVQSCDVYFYHLAHRLKIEGINQGLARFGFGKITGIDIPGEVSGLLASPEWKKQVRRQPWYPGETIITGIGQGYLLVTPLQLATAVATLANHGRAVKPRFLLELEDPVSGVRKPVVRQASQPQQTNEQSIDEEAYQYVIRSMRDVVHGDKGTARHLARGISYQIVGKTGTSQVKSIPQGETYNKETVKKIYADHSLFIGFAPLDEPKIAIAVIVEHAGSGSSTAAPIAGRLINYYLNQQKPSDSDSTSRTSHSKNATTDQTNSVSEN